MNPIPFFQTLPDGTDSVDISDYHGRGFMYVAVCSGPEDMLKVGLSHDPLTRWSAFHPRWFEAFDLQYSLLIETETRRDAQTLETVLRRQLTDHNCPPPMSMRAEVGGSTEWYRGAYEAALAHTRVAAAKGYVVHVPAHGWFAQAMKSRVDHLVGVVDHALRIGMQEGLTPRQKTAVRDLIDAHIVFDQEVLTRLPANLSDLWMQ